ncbi:MAG: hypothetical protein ACPGOY_04685 [Rhodospirillaceae bacterium]
MSSISLSDVKTRDGEPRISDVSLGQGLGLPRPRKIRDIIQRNRDELAWYGSLASQHWEHGCGQDPTAHSDAIYLNEAQALLVCLYARSGRALDVQRQLIQVFTAWRQDSLAQETLKRQTGETAKGAVKSSPQWAEPSWAGHIWLGSDKAMPRPFRPAARWSEPSALSHPVPGGRGRQGTSAHTALSGFRDARKAMEYLFATHGAARVLEARHGRFGGSGPPALVFGMREALPSAMATKCGGVQRLPADVEHAAQCIAHVLPADALYLLVDYAEKCAPPAPDEQDFGPWSSAMAVAVKELKNKGICPELRSSPPPATA